MKLNIYVVILKDPKTGAIYVITKPEYAVERCRLPYKDSFLALTEEQFLDVLLKGAGGKNMWRKEEDVANKLKEYLGNSKKSARVNAAAKFIVAKFKVILRAIECSKKGLACDDINTFTVK